MIAFYGEILGVPNTPLTGDLSEYNCPIWALDGVRSLAVVRDRDGNGQTKARTAWGQKPDTGRQL